MFRHERPQKGRYRQFHQFGVEAFGMPGPDIDAELIQISATLWHELRLAEFVSLEINNIGSAGDRSAYGQALTEFLEAHASELDDDARRRMHSNPMRVLDSKNAAVQSVLQMRRLWQTSSVRKAVSILRHYFSFFSHSASNLRSILNWCEGWIITITVFSNGLLISSVRRVLFAAGGATTDWLRSWEADLPWRQALPWALSV